MKNWHSFRDTHEGDDQCTRCLVTVALEAHLTFTLACPVPPCTSRSNPDEGCVFTPGRGEVSACVYCGQQGGRGVPGDVAAVELDALDLADGDTFDLVDQPAT